ncbi:MAG: hypothetical protein KA007_00780 [Candidatus Pacebacteria bacterium]|nr:hypothetical protein [Candidatus Paceibacterota bacterium]
MEDKKILYVALALVGGIMVGYMTGGSKISVQDQGASTLSSKVVQDVYVENTKSLNNGQDSFRVGTPTVPAVYPTFTIINIDEEEIGQPGPSNDTGIFSFKIRVKANNGDIYIPNSINMAGTIPIPSTNLYFVEKQGYGPITQNTGAVFMTISGANLDTTTNNYLIEWGDAENFVVTVSTTLDSAVDSVINGGDFRGVFSTLKWNASNSPFVYSSLQINAITDWINLN